MPLSLASPHLNFTISTADGRWMMHPAGDETPLIDGARLGARLRARGRPVQWQGELRKPTARREVRESRHGPLETLRLDFTCGLPGLHLAIEAALPRDYPFALLRLILRNEGRAAIEVQRVDLAHVGSAYRSGGGSLDNPVLERLRGMLSERPPEDAPAGALRMHPAAGELSFFVNGWQSWSFSGALNAGQTQPRTRMGPAQRPLNINPATPVPTGRGRFASEMFGVLADRTHRRAVVAGFLSQKEQFGSVEAACEPLAPSLRVRAQCDDVPLPPGGELTTEWAYFQFIVEDDPEPLRVYAEAVAREHGVRPMRPVPTGWCSWYQYFKNVSEASMLANLAALREARDSLPLTVMQLDDGFQPAVGDWFGTNAKFAHGLSWLTGEMREAGLTPGLWLAPFILEQGARLLRERSGWLLKSAAGLPVSAGWHWQKPSYALDLSHPGAQEHIHKLIKAAVHEWGFPYLKLDFLYAGALPGRRHDPSFTRAKALRRGLEIVREAAGDEAFLLGCGCPIGPGVGLFDAFRVGPDVDRFWAPMYFGTKTYFGPETGMPSARNAIRNGLARQPLHRRWWLNDPDCVLLGESAHLSLDEALSLASVIALSGGLMFISDDLASLPPERRAMAEALLPVLERSAVAVDWLERTMPELLAMPLSGPAGDWTVVGLFNFGEAATERVLDLAALGLDPSRSYHISDFWSRLFEAGGEVCELVGPGGRYARTVPPHGGRLLAIRAATPGEAQYVASTLHFSQGAEVTGWQVLGNELQVRIDVGRVAQGAIWLALPGDKVTAEVDGVQVSCEQQGRLSKISLAVNRQAQLRITWTQ